MNTKLTRVIVCDASELEFAGLKYILETEHRHQVVGRACTGEDLRRMIEELSPDTIIIDIAQFENGAELIQTIRKEHSQLAVLVFTREVATAQSVAALAAGAHGLCLKSSSTDKLLSALKSVEMGAIWIEQAALGSILRAQKDNKRHSLKSNAGLTLANSVPGSRYERLTPREQEILELIVEGLNNAEIANQLCLTTDTVKSHIKHIYAKLSVSHRAKAVSTAIKLGMVAA